MKVGPDYQPASPELPDQWRSPSTQAYTFDRPDQLAWWEVFGDPMLNDLIVQAREANLDLRLAVARVEQARAQLGAAKGDLVPSLDAGGSAMTQRSSENTGSPGGAYNSYSGSFDASWEIDLFGKVARSVEAYAADYEASKEDQAGVMVALYAEMAGAYIQVRTTQARIVAVKKNIESQKEMLAITQSRFRNGLASGLDVAQAESSLASSQATIPVLRNELSQAYNSVALLLAREPGAVEEQLGIVVEVPHPPETVAVGVPVDILRQRPDIRQAERQLAAATARIGQATADLYPSFSLTGDLGLASVDPGDFFKGSSHFYSFGPSFSWNLFSGGKIRSQIQVQDALTEQALISYTQTVLGALHDVDNAMTGFYRQGQRVQAQERRVQASDKTLFLAVKLYKEGLQDFQSVLDAQRSLFDADDDLAQAKGDYASGLVSLYQALGGGWRPDPTPEEEPGGRQPQPNQAQAGQTKQEQPPGT